MVSLTGVSAIAGGGLHSLALKSNGTVWAWGNDDFGQLATGRLVMGLAGLATAPPRARWPRRPASSPSPVARTTVWR
ncbi:MAG: RCC1 domain-containing protein [Chloroflexia bacterium]